MKTVSRFAPFLIAVLVSGIALNAQAQQSPQLTHATIAGPLAITGSPSSARHCVSGQAANVHALGWVPSGTNYTITFDSDIPLVTAVSRLNLDADQSVSGYGSPDIRLTASSSGTMSLLVSGNGRTGCYRYKVEIQPTAASTPEALDLPVVSSGRALVKPAKSPIQLMAVTGAASSAKLCVGGAGVARVHAIGRVDAGKRISVAFDSDFDAKAGIANIDLIGQRGTFAIDDDSGGNLDPLLDITTSQTGTIVLYVAGVDGSKGCYHYRVEISAPAGSPSPAPVPVPAPGSLFAGTWRGQALANACFDDGVLEGVCDSFASSSDTFVMVLSQNGSAVSGVLDVGGIAVSVTGTGQGDRLSIGGRGTVVTGIELSVEDWNTSVSGSSMSGTFSMRLFPTASVSGSARLAMSLRGVSRASSVQTLTPTAGGARDGDVVALIKEASTALEAAR